MMITPMIDQKNATATQKIRDNGTNQSAFNQSNLFPGNKLNLPDLGKGFTPPYDMTRACP
jgi:hypothetical protein